MHFRRLELFGFKSFAERTKLDFEPGVTAIVGPNGCGKSNIADSIKWVLGEQSVKALRGAKMEDVIFNGTDAKEPINYAEVSLTLSNESNFLPIEYDEVTVTRRLYRSGESEYLLNKTPVRLKDISEVFMGTGIGQTAYSLIEQGKIDQILSSKPEERREVFEEASGITKYKTKKKEALRRLEDTENNLLRVNDIIAEVKRQINSIERQANKAKKYKEEYEKLKALEIGLGCIEFVQLNNELNSLEKELIELQSKTDQNASEFKNLKQDLEALKASRNEQDSKRLNLRQKISEIESVIFKAHSKLTLNKERLEELAKRKQDLLREIDQVKGRVLLQEQELRLVKGNLNTIDKDNLSISSAIDQKERELSNITIQIKENEENIARNRTLLIDIAARQAKYRSHSAKTSATLTTSRARLQRLRLERENVSREALEIKSKISETEKNSLVITQELNETRQEFEKKLGQNNNLKIALGELDRKINDLQIQKTQLHSRLEFLKEAKAHYEGFSAGVRALLTTQGIDRSNFGIHDVLANLIEVSPGYEECIEAALGDFVESVVVDSREFAREAIRFLKENNAGKAKLIDLSRFKDYADADKENPNISGLVGKAIEFVKTEPRYQGLVNFILRDTYIIKDLDNLKDVATNTNKSFVTLSGELVKDGIINGGGSSKRHWEILNRDLKIKELSATLEDINLKFNEFQKNKLQIEEQITSLTEKINMLGASLNEKEALFTNVKAKDSNLKQLLKGILDEEALVNSELDEINSEIDSLINEEQDLIKKIDQTVQENNLAEESIRNSEQMILEGSKKKEQLLVETAELKTKHAAISEHKSSLEHTIQILENSYNDSLNLFKSRELEIGSLDSKTGELKNQNLDHDSQSKTLAEEKDSCLLELSRIEGDLATLSNTTSLKNKNVLDLESDLNIKRQNIHAKELRKNEIVFGIEGLRQRLRDIYKVELEQIQIQPDELGSDKEKLKEEINTQRAKIDSFGTVNLVAIEEQKELEERFNFLTNQRDDLLKAKDSLLKAITKINRTTRELFMETFEKVKGEFKNYFRLLFGGGQGDLILMDESDVLECGIEIVAQPPGKRLQNISLLSGGERSMTAIALLFAIFKARPSPFCVLDEIDAALDEANVDRFTRILEDFVKSSQFIIITHNKQTINMADVMYGITMEESGISKVVSVKFAEDKTRS